MSEAMEFARNHLGFNFYVEDAIEEDLKAANFILEHQISGEELNRLNTQNAKLALSLSTKEIENENLKEQLRKAEQDYNCLAEHFLETQSLLQRYKKKGLPHVNRSFEQLHVRLKMPQFTCITLQPLFEACPELEVIIAEKAKVSFYQTIISLQFFLLSCFLRPR